MVGSFPPKSLRRVPRLTPQRSGGFLCVGAMDFKVVVELCCLDHVHGPPDVLGGTRDEAPKKGGGQSYFTY